MNVIQQHPYTVNSGRQTPANEHVIVEHLWSRAGATGGNRSQSEPLRERLRARGFPRLPAVPASLLDGKEGVNGSSPLEGFAKGRDLPFHRGVRHDALLHRDREHAARGSSYFLSLLA